MRRSSLQPRGGPQRRGVDDSISGVRPFAYPITYAARSGHNTGFPSKQGSESPLLGRNKHSPHGLWTLRGLGRNVGFPKKLRQTMIRSVVPRWINEAHGTFSPVGSSDFPITDTLMVFACHG